MGDAASGRFDALAKPSGDDRYLREAPPADVALP
jgi:hypothetical protein